MNNWFPAPVSAALACAVLVSWLPPTVVLAGQAQPAPLIRAHAHNDYLHPRPLLDALDHGFCSVEADIHLVEGRLLVAHDRSAVQPSRTLEALYLEPLRERTRRHGGRVYPAGPGFTLLIDLKTDWPRTWPALRTVLTTYADILTSFENGLTRSNAVLVILSGNRSRAMFTNETVRLAALDGTLGDLDAPEPSSLIPLVSSNWRSTFKWRGQGTMPPEEDAQLKEIIAKAHQQGRRVRFWGAPDNPVFWRAAFDAGADLINTDDLAGLESFLRSAPAH